MTDAAGPAAGRRRFRPPRALAIFVILLLATLLASRTCASTSDLLTDEEAIEIAKREIAYTPDGTNIRFLRRGASQHPYWAVSLWQLAADGVTKEPITVVLVDAEDGRVTQVNRETSTP